MSSLAVTFAACAYEQRHLPLQFLLLSQEAIENLAEELDFPKFDGNLEDLTARCHTYYSEPSAWLGLFATLNSFEWVQDFLSQDIDLYSSLFYFRYSYQNEMVKFLVNHPKTSDTAVVELMCIIAKHGKPEILQWFVDQGILQKWQRPMEYMDDPYLAAYTNKRWDNVKVMLESGLISIRQINSTLHFAAGFGSVEGVKMTLEHGATDKVRALDNAKTTMQFYHFSPQLQQPFLEIQELLR